MRIAKKCALIFVFFNEKKIKKDLDDFWHRKLTLKVKFWHQLAKFNDFIWPQLLFSQKLFKFCTLHWKLHYRYCHIYRIIEVLDIGSLCRIGAILEMEPMFLQYLTDPLTQVFYICVGFWLLAHSTRDLSQAEKK